MKPGLHEQEPGLQNILVTHSADSNTAFVLRDVDPEEEVLGVSEAFAVPLIDAQGEVLEKPLVGEFDCRVAKNGESAIVDWKALVPTKGLNLL